MEALQCVQQHSIGAACCHRGVDTVVTLRSRAIKLPAATLGEGDYLVPSRVVFAVAGDCTGSPATCHTSDKVEIVKSGSFRAAALTCTLSQIPTVRVGIVTPEDFQQVGEIVQKGGSGLHYGLPR